MKKDKSAAISSKSEENYFPSTSSSKGSPFVCEYEKSCKKENTVSIKTEASDRESLRNEIRGIVQHHEVNQLHKAHFVYVLPLETLTLNTSEMGKKKNKNFSSIIEISHLEAQRKKIDLLFSSHLEQKTINNDNRILQTLKLPLISHKIVQTKANAFSKLQIFNGSMTFRPYLVTLAFLLRSREQRWRERSLFRTWFQLKTYRK